MNYDDEKKKFGDRVKAARARQVKRKPLTPAEMREIQEQKTKDIRAWADKNGVGKKPATEFYTSGPNKGLPTL
jgi:hypothetical protein